ncbi:MAG: metallophosphoesterase, partial [Candidatus Omnitrophica bacterium]|nr:metallophosphoesterase [Candidatus Omnitrophota bacterium]
MKAFFRRHKVLSISLLCFVLINLYSAIPLVFFYFQKIPDKIDLNQQIIKELEEKQGNNFEFIVMSDTSSGLFVMESTTLKLISRINAEDRFTGKTDIDFVVNVGDVTFRGKEKQYKNYIKIKDRIKFPVISVIGNHDDDIDNGEKGMELFNKYCGSEEFSFIDRNSYFIGLDNKGGDLTESQLENLEKELNNAKEYENIFIFMHKPPFNPYQQSWYRIENSDWSYRFMKMCEKYNVDMVFSGHEYISKVIDFGGVKYA